LKLNLNSHRSQPICRLTRDRTAANQFVVLARVPICVALLTPMFVVVNETDHYISKGS